MRLMLRVGAFLFPAVLAGIVTLEPAMATYPGQNGKIAIAGPGLASIEPNGSILSRLAGWRTNVYNDGPSFSPDGRRIVWTRGSLGASWSRHIYIANADGSDRTQLTDTGDNNDNPSYGPDGTIAFDRGADFSPDSDIWTMNDDGTGLTQITSGPDGDTEPAFFPDGEWIVFVREHDDGYSLQRISAEGGEPTPLTPVLEWLSAPSVSPDGERIAYSDGRIHIIDADGGDRVTLPTPDRVNARYSPVFSPDGDRLLTVDEFEFQCDMWECLYRYSMFTEETDGSDRQVVTRRFDVAEPFWSSPVDWGVRVPTPPVDAPCHGQNPTIVGTDAPETIFGTAGPDVIAGLGSRDAIFGGEGADLMCGGGGNDRIEGEGGRDLLVGGADLDKCTGGPGRDRIHCEKKVR